MESTGDINTLCFEIKDLSIASFLYSTREITFLGKRKLSNGDVVFRFAPKDKAEEMVTKYWNLQAPIIQPKVLFSALRDLKDMIFAS